MKYASATALLGIALLAACDAPVAPTADSAEVVEEAPRELTPRRRVTTLQAELGVVAAFERATNEALQSIEKLGEASSKLPPADLVSDTTKKFTIFFGANNHGERNDCGCHKNPLGGLGRRHTMLNALGGQAGPEVWEDEGGPAIGPVFHVDAGDLFFATNTADRATPQAQATFKYDAESVARALATFPPDAVCAGEHDLVLGAEYLQKLAKIGRFGVTSANLRDASGNLVFDEAIVTERGGVKVAFVGLTKGDSRREGFYASMKLSVEEPFAAATRAIGALVDVDGIVLLSNLGRDETAKLVVKLKNAGTRVDFAIASSTNGMTGDPDFADGIPVMEPMSRGKYLGRADLWMNGAKTEFRNASVATPSALRDYRRAVRSYWTTRRQFTQEELRIAETEMTLETLANSQQPDSGNVVKELTNRRKGAIDVQRQRLETFQTRRDTTSELLMLAIAKAEPSDAAVGDDWISGRVVPVKIEFVGEKSTRAVLDPREKKRPKESAGSRLRPH